MNVVFYEGLRREFIKLILSAKYWELLIRFTFLVMKQIWWPSDHLCCLVDRVPGYRSRGQGSFPGATDFLRSSGSGVGSTQPRG
jgi:hypothetical protein